MQDNTQGSVKHFEAMHFKMFITALRVIFFFCETSMDEEQESL